MAKLVVTVTNQGIKSTIDAVASLRAELEKLSGIKYDGTNAKIIADKVLSDNQALLAKHFHSGLGDCTSPRSWNQITILLTNRRNVAKKTCLVPPV